MADASTGVPSAADLLTFSDAEAGVFKGIYSSLGLGLSTETTTFAALTKTARGKVLGDGSTQYGISNAPLKSALKDAYAQSVASSRYDSIFATYCRSKITQVENAIKTNLPTDSNGTRWNFTPSGHLSTLDSYLLYLNGMNATVPTTPAAAGVLTATTVAGGGLTSAANCPYVVHCLVSTSGDMFVSLPSAEATRVAISGGNNALSYQIAGNVPTGVGYVAIFRGYNGGSSGTWYLDDRTAVTAGQPYPAIIISRPDSALRADWAVPSWASCLWVPEAAAIFGLAYATALGSTGAAQNPLVFTSGLQLTPNNVALTPSSGFLGLGNPSQTGVFGVDVVGTGYTAGSIATANSYGSNTQGFAGAGGVANALQAVVTSALNAAGTTAPSIGFYDAAHGWGNLQTTTLGAATFSGTAANQTAIPTLTNGRIVQSVTAVSNGGGLSSGTYEWRAVAPRSY